tara:strand:+ start:38 stop:280 length:243 start_codon:yes stop_codon:yes gene_type:complete
VVTLHLKCNYEEKELGKSRVTSEDEHWTELNNLLFLGRCVGAIAIDLANRNVYKTRTTKVVRAVIECTENHNHTQIDRHG